MDAYLKPLGQGFAESLAEEGIDVFLRGKAFRFRPEDQDPEQGAKTLFPQVNEAPEMPRPPRGGCVGKEGLSAFGKRAAFGLHVDRRALLHLEQIIQPTVEDSGFGPKGNEAGEDLRPFLREEPLRERTMRTRMDQDPVARSLTRQQIPGRAAVPSRGLPQQDLRPRAQYLGEAPWIVHVGLNHPPGDIHQGQKAIEPLEEDAFSVGRKGEAPIFQG